MMNEQESAETAREEFRIPASVTYWLMKMLFCTFRPLPPPDNDSEYYSEKDEDRASRIIMTSESGRYASNIIKQ